jgi:hypothetical protein
MNQTEIISNAITLLGNGVTTSLVNQPPIVDSAIQAYNLFFPMDMEQLNWRFSCKIVSLTNQSLPNLITGSGVGVLNLTSNLTVGVVYAATFTTTNTLPLTVPALSLGTTYYVVPVTATTIRVYANAIDAQADTNRFTITNGGVGSSVNAGPNGGYWQYAYTLPADFLKLVHLFPQNYAYEMYSKDLMYSNFNNSSQPLYMEYQSLPDVTLCPTYYAYSLALKIASYLSLSTAQNVDYAKYLQYQSDIQMAKAQATDAQGRPQTFMQNAPALSMRFVSTYASG